MHFLHFPTKTYLKLIDTFTKKGVLRLGRELHAYLIINGLVNSSQFASKLVTLYCRCKHLTDARKLFEVSPHKSIFQWVSVIGSYTRYGYYQEAMDLFFEMRTEGFRYDRIVIPSILKACSQLSDWRTGKYLHAVVFRYGFYSDAFIVCGLINMYSKCGEVETARRVFMGMMEKDLAILNAMVSGYVQNGFLKEAFLLVEEMIHGGWKPDMVTWNTLISGYSQTNDQVMVRKILEVMEDYGLKPDVVTWTSLISSSVQNFQNIEALVVFRKMLKAGVFPTSATISCLLPASANIANLMHGKEIHGYSLVMGIGEDLYVKSALIDMYAKCGSIFDAMCIFQNMPDRTTVTWNSIIFGYANYGYCNEAIVLFDKMVNDEGEKVDHLTFMAALTACSNGGIVDFGESLLKLMKEKFEISPRVEHYACVVDLLGRAGKVNEAYGVIQNMPIEPDKFVWGALLGACRLHGCNVELAELAVKELARLEPDSVGSGLMLSSLYADCNEWGNVREMKKIMKKRKLTSFPSCSWIEVV